MGDRTPTQIKITRTLIKCLVTMKEVILFGKQSSVKIFQISGQRITCMTVILDFIKPVCCFLKNIYIRAQWYLTYSSC